ncbi:MAG: DUF805 domain-containing protein, partial [Gammaproteobacteria bacterium]
MTRDNTAQPDIFDAAARIGRLRYLTYCTAILALLTLPGLLLCTRLYYIYQCRAAATLIFVCLSIFAPALYGRLAVRRLHDLGRSGWWASAYAAAYLWLLIANVSRHREPPVIIDLRAMLVPALCNFALFMALALLPGMTSENRFGSPTASNPISLKRVLVAWLLLCAVWVSIPISRIVHYRYLYQERIDQSVQQARSTEAPLQ